MNPIHEVRETLGKRLGEITRDVREARRVAEEKAETARVKAEREMLVRARGDDLFERCAEDAKKAALDGLNTVTSDLPVSTSDVLLHLEIGQYVVAELIRCGCRSELMNEHLGDETKSFRVHIGWDVPEMTQIDDPIEREVVAPIPPSEWPRQAHALGAVALKRVAVPIAQDAVDVASMELTETHPCAKCASRHTGKGLEDKVFCNCSCHVFSGTKLSPVPT